MAGYKQAVSIHTAAIRDRGKIAHRQDTQRHSVQSRVSFRLSLPSRGALFHSVLVQTLHNILGKGPFSAGLAMRWQGITKKQIDVRAHRHQARREKLCTDTG